MPYEISEQDGKWVVKNKNTGKVHGTHDSRKGAVRQMRLLYMIEGGKKPTGAKSTLE